jgi:hypothetical protein
VDGFLGGVPGVTNATLTDSDSPVAFGAESSLNGGFFSGSLDEVAIYPAALSLEQISAHFQLGSLP